VAFYTRDSNSFSGDSNEDLSNFLRWGKFSDSI
jgi:hypothetical protein